MPITDIANLMQLHETVCTTTIPLLAEFHDVFQQVSRHKHVALNFYHDSWPSSRAVLFLCERAAADKTFEDIYFAKVNVPEQEVRLPNIPLHSRPDALPGHSPLFGNRTEHGE